MPSSSPRDSCPSANVNTAESASMTAVSISMRTLPVRRNSPASSNSKPVASASSADDREIALRDPRRLRAHHVRLPVEERADRTRTAARRRHRCFGRRPRARRPARARSGAGMLRDGACHVLGILAPECPPSSPCAARRRAVASPRRGSRTLSSDSTFEVSGENRSASVMIVSGFEPSVGTLRISTSPTRSSSEPSFAYLALAAEIDHAVSSAG